MELTGVEAAAYERVSKDTDGDEKSPEEQHDAHIVTCERMGWTLQPLAYRDVGSASIHKRKARGNFDRLIADLEEDRFTAKVLMLWESSRGSRETEEWLHLINLCTKRGVVFWVDVHDRTYDPRKARDRKSLIDDASTSEYETSLMSERIRRTTKSSAAKGRPHGRIPFGYTRRYDPETKKLIAQEEHPIEGPIVREMYARVLKGHSLKGIARDLNGRGLYRRGGGEWVPQNIALLLLHECYMGLRVHDPDRGTAYNPMTPNAKVVDAVWQGLVTPNTFYSAKRILRDPSRKTVEHPGAVQHLLTGLAVCDVCGERLRVNRRSGTFKYLCVKNGCVTISKDGDDGLDKLAEEAIIKYLSRPELLEELRVGGAADSELEEVEGKLAKAYDDKAKLKARADAEEVSLDFAMEMAPGIAARIAKYTARAAELRVPRVLLHLIKPGAEVRKQWEAAGLSTRREIARLVLVKAGPGELGLGVLRVKRAGPVSGKKRVPAVRRVVFDVEDD